METGLYATVWLDDQHAIIRRGMAASLTADGFTVIGESAGLRPVPRLDGVGLFIVELDAGVLRHVIRLVTGRPTRVVVTMREDQAGEIPLLIESGVRAILRHDELTPETLTNTLRTVGAGSTTAPAEMMIRAMSYARTVALGGTGALTTRERDVLRRLAEGAETLDIAQEMSYSERTVKNVVHDIMMKLNCRTRAHAVALATRSGVI
ncbi:LuxR C-terminal-related transcriptional regulator [Propionibacteriaceae bacterium Y2011]|uniref:response regulator transcription factor n=1 Tax=Microlunatus sp. Y2014 TaxID=3418488 RepID=UPI003B444E61